MTKHSLLLVDDDENVLAVLEGELAKAGNLVTTAGGCEQALAKVSVARPDLVVTAADMAGMDGFELRRRLALSPASADIPMLFLAGQAGAPVLARFRALGIDDFLTEPIYMKDVLLLVDKIVERERITPSGALFEVDTRKLADSLAELPDAANAILRLVDGHLTVRDIVRASGLPRDDAFAMLRNLVEARFLLAAPDIQATTDQAPDEGAVPAGPMDDAPTSVMTIPAPGPTSDESTPWHLNPALFTTVDLKTTQQLFPSFPKEPESAPASSPPAAPFAMSEPAAGDDGSTDRFTRLEDLPAPAPMEEEVANPPVDEAPVEAAAGADESVGPTPVAPSAPAVSEPAPEMIDDGLTRPHMIVPETVGNAVAGTLFGVAPVEVPPELEAGAAADEPASQETLFPSSGEEGESEAPPLSLLEAVAAAEAKVSSMGEAPSAPATVTPPVGTEEVAAWYDQAKSGRRRQVVFVVGLLVVVGVTLAAVDFFGGGDGPAAAADAAPPKQAPPPARIGERAAGPLDAALPPMPSLILDDAAAVTLVRPKGDPARKQAPAPSVQQQPAPSRPSSSVKTDDSPPAPSPAAGAADLVKQAGKQKRAGQREQALGLLDQALLQAPSSTEALILKADILLDLGRSSEAMAACDRAIQVSGSNADAWLTKGTVHLSRDQNAEAKKAFQRYLELRPKGNKADEVRAILDSL